MKSVLPLQQSTPNHRLRRHADYQWVYAHGRKQFGKGMGYFYAVRPPADSPDARRSETPGPRIGLTVPKALGKAVDRNRIKRRLREAVRRALPLLQAPVDVVLHPRRGARDAAWPALEREVAGVFRAVQAAAERALLQRAAMSPVTSVGDEQK